MNPRAILSGVDGSVHFYFPTWGDAAAFVEALMRPADHSIWMPDTWARAQTYVGPERPCWLCEGVGCSECHGHGDAP